MSMSACTKMRVVLYGHTCRMKATPSNNHLIYNERHDRTGLPWTINSSKYIERKKPHIFIRNSKFLNCKTLVIRLGIFFIFMFAALSLMFPYILVQSKNAFGFGPQKKVKLSFGDRKSLDLVRESVHTRIQYRGIEAVDWSHVNSIIPSLKISTKIGKELQIGLLNFQEDEDIILQWKAYEGKIRLQTLPFEPAPDEELKWEDLFPEWVDEDEDFGVPKCPLLPMPRILKQGTKLDLVVANVPCKREREDWSRSVARLHVHLAAAHAAISTSSSHLILLSSCRPIANLFTCQELLLHEEDIWAFKVNPNRLDKILSLPIGACELAAPTKGKVWALDKANPRREAYVTILHSDESYVCGAIVLAQSIRMTGSIRDLVILVDKNIKKKAQEGLKSAGWLVKEIKRIRNPNAEPNSYNEWNYSKLRLWQLTSYTKVIFVDADQLVLRNIDFLFNLPEISATSNNKVRFNSGLMVIEPSNCTFNYLMEEIHSIVSYNGGDQGFLNEAFPWWHRLHQNLNFLKHYWSNDIKEYDKKARLFGADPPELYVIHYLGIKPWLCFRDYDCNWDEELMRGRKFASDEAHAGWWKVHDRMPHALQDYCLLDTHQKVILQMNRKAAQASAFPDQHWKINITDPRLHICYNTNNETCN